MLLFVLLLITLMIPAQITAIPQFIIFKTLGLYGTQAPLYLPCVPGRGLRHLPDAAVFPDHPAGAGRGRADRRGRRLARIFFTIYLPLSKPALAAFAIFAFLFSWNDLFSALIYLPSDLEQTTLTVGLALFQTAVCGAVAADDGGGAGVGRADDPGLHPGAAALRQRDRGDGVEVAAFAGRPGGGSGRVAFCPEKRRETA